MKWFAAFALSTTIAGSAHAANTEVLVNHTLGLEIAKPADWVNLSADANIKNLNRVFESDPEFQSLIAKYATSPIFAFTKFPEPLSDLNPSIKINAKPIGQMGGKSATEFLSILVPMLSKALPELAVQQSPQDTIIGGKAAAYARFSYILAVDENRYPTTSEMWIVPNGSYFLMIGAGTRQDEANGTREEIHSILNTLKIVP